jgi:Hypothetical glycosyl hydrolase family 15
MLRALLAALALFAVLAAAADAKLRPIPDTSDRIRVWNDQYSLPLSDAQVRFLARNNAGTQKIPPAEADRFRRVNPGFLVLHYRLGIGSGPVPFLICGQWRSDYAANVASRDDWFFELGGRRTRHVQFDWWVMNPDSGWRRYWAKRVLSEVRCNRDDGVFADSTSPPQYLGPSNFSPPFEFFVGERAWEQRITRFLKYERGRLRGRAYLVPNAGSLVTTRDRTDYSVADGVMIEGFAFSDAASPYAVADWELQLDRVLRLVRLNRIVIGQSYVRPADLGARGFALASYLLVKGKRTFLNLESGGAEWYPEYGVDLGRARSGPPRSVRSLRVASGAYVREYERGVVVANPSDAGVRYAFTGNRRLVRPRGGGDLPASADVSGWGLDTTPVSGSVTVPAHGGVILLR